MGLGGFSGTTFGALLRSDQSKYWWVPEGSTDDALGPYFPQNDETILVKVDQKPKLGPVPSEKFRCAIMGTRDEDGWCYDRFFFQDSCEMQWLLNVFLKEHMPTGGIPKVEKIRSRKGQAALARGIGWVPPQTQRSNPCPVGSTRSALAASWRSKPPCNSVVSTHCATSCSGALHPRLGSDARKCMARTTIALVSRSRTMSRLSYQ